MEDKKKYLVVKDYLAEQIRSGTIKPHDSIGSENYLAEKFNLSRMTIRKAIDELVNEGRLYRIKGSGTYVSESKFSKSSQGFTCFTEDMLQRGMIPSSKLISFELVELDANIANFLYLQQDDLAYQMKRVRMANGNPMSLEVTYVPRAIVGKMRPQDAEGSLFRYFEQVLNLEISHSIQEIEACLSTEAESGLLDIPVGTPLLQITSNSFLSNGQPFEYAESLYRADRYKFLQVARRKKD